MSVFDAKLQYMKLSDGTLIYYQKWMPDSPRANLVFVHGLTDHVGRYGAFTRYFTTRGYGVHLFDMRGHGRSGGREADIGSFYDYLADLSQFVNFVKKTSPSAPLFLIGHSFGGQVVLNFVVRYDKGVRGVIALSPNIGIRLELPKWKLKLGRIAAKLFPRYRVSYNLDPKLLTHDREVIKDYESDPNIRRSITLKCALEIFNNEELMMGIAGRIHLPILMMHGGADQICDPEATKKFYMRVPVYNKKLKIYPGLLHELLNEKDKSDIFRDIENWMEDQLGIEYKLAGGSGRGDG